jgi:hypothetical protein
MLLPLSLFVFARNTEIKNGCKAKKTAAIKDLKASINKDDDFKIYFPKLIYSTSAYRIACTHLVLSGAARTRLHFISPPTEQSDFQANSHDSIVCHTIFVHFSGSHDMTTLSPLL